KEQVNCVANFILANIPSPSCGVYLDFNDEKKLTFLFEQLLRLNWEQGYFRKTPIDFVLSMLEFSNPRSNFLCKLVIKLLEIRLYCYAFNWISLYSNDRLFLIDIIVETFDLFTSLNNFLSTYHVNYVHVFVYSS